MKQTLLLVAICIGLVLCAVGYSDSKYHTALGRKAPDFYAENDCGSVSSASLRGDYTLLNFWASTDAPSREAAAIPIKNFVSYPSISTRTMPYSGKLCGSTASYPLSSIMSQAIRQELLLIITVLKTASVPF